MQDERWRYVVLGPLKNNRRKAVLFGFSARDDEYVAIPGHSTNAPKIDHDQFKKLHAGHPQAIRIVEEAFKNAEEVVFVKKEKPKIKSKRKVITIIIEEE